MKTLTLLILETDPDYGERLAKYISSREDSPFLVRLFLTHPCPAGELLQADAAVADAALWSQYRSLPRSCPGLIRNADLQRRCQDPLRVIPLLQSVRGAPPASVPFTSAVPL